MNRKRTHSESDSEFKLNKKIKYQGCAIILMGLPGSGKSYLSPKIINHINKIVDNQYDFKNLNPDNVKISGRFNILKALSMKCRIITKKLSDIFKSSNPQSFIYDGTGSNKSTYNYIFKNCKNKDYQLFLVYVKTPLEKALERNQTRNRKVDHKFITKYSKYIDSNFEYYKKQNINYFVIDNSEIFDKELKIIDSKIEKN